MFGLQICDGFALHGGPYHFFETRQLLQLRVLERLQPFGLRQRHAAGLPPNPSPPYVRVTARRRACFKPLEIPINAVGMYRGLISAVAMEACVIMTYIFGLRSRMCSPHYLRNTLFNVPTWPYLIDVPQSRLQVHCNNSTVRFPELPQIDRSGAAFSSNEIRLWHQPCSYVR